MSGRCHKCGAPAPFTVLARDGVAIGGGRLCDPCFDLAVENAAALREEFEAMLADGVSRDEANQILIAKIDGKAASA